MGKKSVLLGVMLLLVLSAAAFVVFFSADREGPVITVDADRVVPYSKEQGEHTLLSYVKATDQKDGDVTASVIIESIYLSSDLSAANVIYAARDSKGNITKLRYTFDYLPTQEELASDLTVQEPESTLGSPENNGETTAPAGPGQETTTVQQQTAQEAAEGTTTAGGPLITLTTTETTIAAGSTFNVMLYVKSISDDKDSQDVLSRRVIAGGTFDPSVPGDYTVEVYCRDTDGNMSNKAQLMLHVK